MSYVLLWQPRVCSFDSNDYVMLFLENKYDDDDVGEEQPHESDGTEAVQLRVGNERDSGNGAAVESIVTFSQLINDESVKATAHFNHDQRFSIGLRSGLFPGHSSTSTLFSVYQFLHFLAVWQGHHPAGKYTRATQLRLP